MPATGPSAVILAAGLGTRFGGMKELAAVAPDGVAIMDVLLRRAAAAGFARAVIVVGPGMEASIRDHVDAHRDPEHAPAVELVVQQLRPDRTKPLGTADAVLATREMIAGPFAVMNADDLYPPDAFVLLERHLRTAPPDEHGVVAFRVGGTLVADRPVSRAVVDVDAGGALTGIREGRVVVEGAGLRFEGRSGGGGIPLSSEQIVSMNMWGFRESVFDALADAVGEFVAEDRAGEVYLPEVVASMVAAGALVRVLVSEGACLGITHADDLAAVRDALS